MTEKYFNPLSDITAYELAFIYAHVRIVDDGTIKPLAQKTVTFLNDRWETLPPAIQRHFTDEPMNKHWL